MHYFNYPGSTKPEIQKTYFIKIGRLHFSKSLKHYGVIYYSDTKFIIICQVSTNVIVPGPMGVLLRPRWEFSGTLYSCCYRSLGH